MKITTMIKTAVALVGMTMIAFGSAPIASAAAYPITGKLGGWPIHKTNQNLGCPIHAVSPHEWAFVRKHEPHPLPEPINPT